MNNPIQDPMDFLAQLRTAIKDNSPIVTMHERSCVITRSPAYYGHEGSVLIEWEGSPPKFSICYSAGCIPLVNRRPIKWQQMGLANSIIHRFLDAHPATEDGSPVWVGIPWSEKP